MKESVKKKIQDIKIDVSESILSALKKMDHTYRRLLLVFEGGKFINVLSIGDIQRAIIRNQPLDTPINKILRKETRVAHIKDSFDFIKAQMLKYKAECMPVIDDKSQLVNVHFWEDAFREWCKKNNIVAEFTRFNPLINNYIFSERYLEVIKDRNTVYIDLDKDIDTIRAGFSSSTKRAIKKAIKNKLYITISEKQFNHKHAFIKLYNETMYRVDSTDYLFFNKEYFDRLFNLNNFVQIVIEYNNKPIASSICFYSDKYFHYHLGASKKEYLNYRPNDLLFEEMIKYAKLKNCSFIHLGGGNTLDENDSLFRFKKGFSKSYLDFYIGKKIHNQTIYDKVVSQWKIKYPESCNKNKNLLLGYREIKK